MKIALIGYGKMGHIIERIARERGHDITAIIDVDNQSDFDSEGFRNADIAIEFTTPKTAMANCLRALRAGMGVVCGSTGWTDTLQSVEQEARNLGGSFLWSSNFSIGVNIFMALNRTLAKMMSKFPQYTPSLVETHHVHKLDHPSGTAVTLAEDVVKANDHVGSWAEEAPVREGTMIVSHIRRGEVPGIHEIIWDSPIDTIGICHSAKTREGFALGAVMAAEWLNAHPGVHTMQEMMAELLS